MLSIATPDSALAHRLEALGELRGLVADRAEELVAAAAALFPFPRGVISADLALTLRRLDAFPGLRTRLADRLPLGAIALALPGNAILSNPLATVGAAFLAGNRTMARLPRARGPWARVLAELCRATLADTVEFVDTDGPGFVRTALADREIGAIMTFGDDTWARHYEDAARRSDTRFIFEGPGKDPFLVLSTESASRAARAAVEAGMYNAGQACTAPERCYVLSSAYDEFLAEVLDRAGRLTIGSPDEAGVQVGPVARGVADRLTSQLAEAVAGGAVVHTAAVARDITVHGESRVLVPPTVVTGADHGMRLMTDETFGPVLAIVKVDSVEDAVRLAESSRYGLSASVFGGPRWVAERLARSHGEIFTDETWLDRRDRDPLAPYGGRRASGWVWEWRRDQFVRRDGPRFNILEFSRPGTSA